MVSENEYTLHLYGQLARAYDLRKRIYAALVNKLDQAYGIGKKYLHPRVFFSR